MSLEYRAASVHDADAMARTRAQAGWTGGAGASVIARYLAGEHHPQQALPDRVAYVAEEDGTIVGYIAGHCTQRFGADGEVQWILVSPEHRGGDVAAQLLRHLAGWFSARNAARICVNVEPANAQARRFYAKHGALEVSEYWMEWPRIADVLSEGRQA